MKILLIGLLSIASLSVFANDVKVDISDMSRISKCSQVEN